LLQGIPSLLRFSFFVGVSFEAVRYEHGRVTQTHAERGDCPKQNRRFLSICPERHLKKVEKLLFDGCPSGDTFTQ
jgi:hypothetical protein